MQILPIKIQPIHLVLLLSEARGIALQSVLVVEVDGAGDGLVEVIYLLHLRIAILFLRRKVKWVLLEKPALGIGLLIASVDHNLSLLRQIIELLLLDHDVIYVLLVVVVGEIYDSVRLIYEFPGYLAALIRIKRVKICMKQPKHFQ